MKYYSRCYKLGLMLALKSFKFGKPLDGPIESPSESLANNSE